jgi:hypothetical protein
MKAREKLSWFLAGVFALAGGVGWVFYWSERTDRAEEREQLRATMHLLQSHAIRGMTRDAQIAKERAESADNPPRVPMSP